MKNDDGCTVCRIGDAERLVLCMDKLEERIGDAERLVLCIDRKSTV